MPDILEIESELGINTKAAIIESVEHPILAHSGIHLHIKRDDLLHPIISGNKWRKLKYTLLYALTKGHEHLISMGGPYSNHLHALAYIGHKLNLKTTGLIRGEQPTVDNYTLADMKKWGMNLKFITRGAFRDLRKYRNHDAEPAKKYNGFWIAEGGACHNALCGAAEIVKEIELDFDTLTLACGTGTTLAGIARTIPASKKVLGFSALKGGGFLENNIKKLLHMKGMPNWSVNFEYHFGGFAKTTDELASFIEVFQSQNNIPLERLYNGKMLYGLLDLIKNDRFKKNHKVIAIHTGGLQGNR